MLKITSKHIIAILLIFIFSYLVILPYYQHFLETERCGTQPCPMNLPELWANAGCTSSPEESLLFRAHIITEENGSVRTFDCQLGKIYGEIVKNSSNFMLLKCDMDTIEAIDSVVKGTNTSPIPFAQLDSTYPNLTDYAFNVLVCKKNNGRDAIFFYVDVSGVLYP